MDVEFLSSTIITFIVNITLSNRTIAMYSLRLFANTVTFNTPKSHLRGGGEQFFSMIHPM